MILDIENSNVIDASFATSSAKPKTGPITIESVKGEGVIKYINKLMFIPKNLFYTYFDINKNGLAFFNDYGPLTYCINPLDPYVDFVTNFIKIHNESYY